MHLGRRGVQMKQEEGSKNRKIPRSPKGVEAERRLQSMIASTASILPAKSPLPPIEDAAKERAIIEKKGRWAWEEWLVKKALAKPARQVTVSPTEVKDRICEVYRQCFNNSRQGDLSVISEFAARFPNLVFRCAWIQELVSAFAPIRRYDEYARRLLRAIGSGFRRAGAKRSWKRLSRATRIEAARDLQRKLSRELSHWMKSLDSAHAVKSRLHTEETKKLSQVLQEYHLSESSQTRFRMLLETGQAYKASLLIAAITYGVRERELQSRTATF